MLEGGCLCGSIRYRIDAEPTDSGVCHCRTCRKTASAPALPFATVASAAFSFTRGEPAAFRSSSSATRRFCGRCGSPLTYHNDDSPELVDIMTCSLDDPERIAPRFHIWLSHKLRWEEIGLGLLQFPERRSDP
ncbi:GFA family protein [Methylocystis bryophila]|uniref:CENP-V/GFA domain-containing protein n=1 Tax=Methylocystis bryophila TaxID=655015 RepID=A0A1W6MWK9_9HYPH|nr:GFA family protein [Methylocystis bryophila]ARN81945.1 hypothetical protein B1812_13605 [Methylocystis bryophila]